MIRNIGRMQLSALLGPALGAVVGGVAAALVTVALLGPDEKEKRQPATAGIEAEDDPELDDEPSSSELEERVIRLEQAVGSLARRAVSTPAAAGAGQPDGAAEQPIVDDPVFEAAVRDVVDRLEEERNTDRELRRAERRKQRAERWAANLADKLRLSEQQRAAISAINQRFQDQFRQAARGDGGFLDRDARRARFAELRTQAEAELARVLDGSQLQSYRELPEKEQLGGRRGRDREDRGERGRRGQ